MLSNTLICSFQLGACEDSQPPESGRQPTAYQQVSAPTLQDAHSQLCCGVRVGVVALRRGLVDRVIPAVLRELLIQELATPITVEPEDQRVRQIAVIVIYFG